jgi:hypothetical protein
VAVDEHYMKIRRSLERKLGVEEASYLMDRPAGGWSELVTNQTLDLKFAVVDQQFEALRHELRSEIHDVRHELKSEIQALRVELHRTIRQQTWALMTALTVFAAIFGLLART